MNKQEAKRVLRLHRPNRPQKRDKRQLQQAIDTAIETIDAYESILSTVKVDIRSKWRKDRDTLKCTNCGFGYFPTDFFFMNSVPIITSTNGQHYFVFKYCPNCGEKMGYDEK